MYIIVDPAIVVLKELLIIKLLYYHVLNVNKFKLKSLKLKFEINNYLFFIFKIY